MTTWTFRLVGVPYIPMEGYTTRWIMPTLKAEGESWEEAYEKIKDQIPAGATAEPFTNDIRFPDEEVLSDEYIALIKARKEAGETDAQARILNR